MTSKTTTKRAKEGISAGIDSIQFERYDEAKEEFAKVIDEIMSSRVIDQSRNNHAGLHKNYVSTAAFGEGFAEVLLRYREILQSPKHLENIAKEAYDFYNASESEERWNYLPERHRNIGKGYGALGLRKEGLKILDFGRRGNIFKGYYERQLKND